MELPGFLTSMQPIKRLLESNIDTIKSISSNRRHALRYIDGTLDAKADGFQQDGEFHVHF